MSLSPRNPEKTLQRLDWTVIRRLDGLLQGDYRTLFHGFGLDLADLREYQFTDDADVFGIGLIQRFGAPPKPEKRTITHWPIPEFKTEPKKVEVDASGRIIKGYKVKRDSSGKIIKDENGNFVFFPVYEEEQGK